MTSPKRLSALVAAIAAVGLALQMPVEAAQRGTGQGGGQGQGQGQGRGQGEGRGAQRQPRARAGRPSAAGQGSQRSALEQGTRSLSRSSATPAAPAGADDRGRAGGSPGQEVYPFGYPPEQEQLVYFATADVDSSEWISFREAEGALRFDADNFCVYDVDNDGRLTFAEFSDYIKSEAAAGRLVREPIREEYLGSPPQRTAEQLRSAYDVDLDGAISARELERMLGDYDVESLQGVDASKILARLDANGSSVLETSELERITSYLGPPESSSEGKPLPQPGARSVLEMFGQPIPRGDTIPPQIVGPVPPFRRLDVDNDGFVDINDLQALEGGSFLPVRLSGVLNSLDLDSDGRLSESEFLASMTRK